MCFFADVVERIAQAHGGGGLALAGRGRRDGGDQNQFAVLFILEAVDIIERYLGLVAAIGLKGFFGDAELGGDILNFVHFRLLGDFDITKHLNPP